MSVFLGIETSCDDTGIAIINDQGLQSNLIYTQKIHQKYGGVVPELASRDHIRKINPLLKKALSDTGYKAKDIDYIAYTAGPGLLGSLLVGASFARSLAWAWKKPSVAIHHLEAHMLVAMMTEKNLKFPFLTLLVSGGHTQLIVVTDIKKYEIIGETLDDSAGEAFDKTAKLIGLSYPGGPELAKLAEQGNANIKLTIPMLNNNNLDFSFSGLKTQVSTLWQKNQNSADMAASFQKTIVESLLIKCKRAIKQTGLDKLVISGGVASNKLLRQKFNEMSENLNINLYFPPIEFCTDNAAMVAYCAWLNHKHGQLNIDNNFSINVQAKWPLDLFRN